MPQKFLVELLEVEGFRGHLDSLAFPVEGRSALLLGPQGTGKTSTLAAIEWCLFGKLAYFKSAESKTDTELVNAQRVDEACRVRLRLRDGNRQVEVERTKRARIRETELAVRADGEAWAGQDAEQRIFTIFGLTFDDFYRSVHLHQESVRGLITEDPRQRDEAIDRLLGLERARDLLGAFPLRDAREAIADLSTKKEKLENQITGATRQVQAELERALREAHELGLEDDQITMDSASELAERLQKQVGKLAKENGLDSVEFPAAEELLSLPKIVTRAKSFFKACRNKVIEVTNVDPLRERRTALVDVKEILQRLDRSDAQVRKARIAIEERFGKRDEIALKIEKEAANIRRLEARREKLDSLSRLAEDAISLFERTPPVKCPVCGHPVKPKEIKKHLRELLKAGKKTELDAIAAGVKASKNLIEEFEDAAHEQERLENERASISQQRIENLEDVAELLGRKLDEGKARKELAADVDHIEDELAKAQRAYKRREEGIGRAEAASEALKMIHVVMQKRQEFDVLKQRFSEQDREISGLKERIAELDVFRARLQDIVEALATVQVELAKDSVEKGKDEMEKLYSGLHTHQYYSSFKLDVSTKSVAGVQKNTYLIQAFNPRDAKQTFIGGRFSTGQMNCAALAIFFALSKMASHNLGFLILDDPSQNLDSEHKAALSEVLREVAREKQLFIATQDEELQRNLRTLFRPGKNAVIAEFHAWSKKGPEVELTV